MKQSEIPEALEGKSPVYTETGLLEVIHILPTAIAVIDEHMKVTLANRAALGLVNREEEAFVGHICGEALGCVNHYNTPGGCGFGTACLRCRLRQTVQNTLRLNQPYQMVETSMVFKGYGEMHMRISTLPMNISGYHGVLLALEDITRAKEHERIRLEKERLSAVVETAGAVCHEMNQPLMTIQGFSELLLEDLPADSSHRENLLQIQKQARRLGEITGKLMTITRYRTKRYLKRDILDIDSSSGFADTGTEQE